MISKNRSRSLICVTWFSLLSLIIYLSFITETLWKVLDYIKRHNSCTTVFPPEGWQPSHWRSSCGIEQTLAARSQRPMGMFLSFFMQNMRLHSIPNGILCRWIGVLATELNTQKKNSWKRVKENSRCLISVPWANTGTSLVEMMYIQGETETMEESVAADFQGCHKSKNVK